MAMQNDAFRRVFREPLFAACAGACFLWAGMLQGADAATPKNTAIKNSEDISAELDRETNLISENDSDEIPVRVFLDRVSRYTDSS